MLCNGATVNIVDNDAIANTTASHNHEYVPKYSWMDLIVHPGVNTRLRILHLQTVVWDKENMQCTHGSGDPHFKIMGLQTAPKGAAWYVILETLRSAADAGILHILHAKGLWPKSLLNI